MLNERPARGVQKTPRMCLNHMIPGGVLPPGSQSRFLNLARKRADRSDLTFSSSQFRLISRSVCCEKTNVIRKVIKFTGMYFLVSIKNLVLLQVLNTIYYILFILGLKGFPWPNKYLSIIIINTE